MRAPIYTSGSGPDFGGNAPQMPDAQLPWGAGAYYNPTGISDTVVLYHGGHGPSRDKCIPNGDQSVDFFNELGCVYSITKSSKSHT